jgi:hypothetical protein
MIFHIYENIKWISTCVLPDSKICCYYFCLIKRPIPFIKDWILQKKKSKSKCKQHDPYNTKKLIRIIIIGKLKIIRKINRFRVSDSGSKS